MASVTAEMTRLMSNVRNHVPGALDAAIQLELFNVMDELLQASNFWQEQISYTVGVTSATYELVGAEPGNIVSLLGNVNSAGLPVAAAMPVLGTIVLKTTPSEADTFTATVSYTVVDPTDTNSYPVIPDGLLRKYGLGITAGVVGKMMSQPAKPYTNERMGIFNTRKFQGVIAQARAAVLHQNIAGGQTWRFPRIARGHQR